MNKIVYGDIEFVESDILRGNYILEHAKAGESLAYDAFTFTILYDAREGFITADGKRFTTSDDKGFFVVGVGESSPLIDFIPGSPIFFYQDDKLINKFYLSDVKRVSKDSYRFECESVIGLLDKSMHPGGIYNGIPITDLLDEIFEEIEYELNPIASNIKIYGWLPYATKRENLQQITLATALSLTTNPDGKPYFTALTSDIKSTFDSNRLVMGSNVDVSTPCTMLQVTEHQFLESDEEIILCNESFVTTKLVLFPEPVYDLDITGGTIIDSSSNHATVAGSGNVLLKGKKYIHNMKMITIGDSDKKVLQIKDATLITSLNSNAVATKLFEAFNKTTSIKSTILRNNEKPGNVVEILNPYTKQLESGFLYKMASEITRSPLADIEVLMGYTPSGVITGYKNRVVLTSGTSWQVPAGVTEIRAVLIGGGDGGQAGFDGERGDNGGEFPQLSYHLDPDDDSPNILSHNGDAGDGGAGGAGGAGGKILDTGPLLVTPQDSIPFTIGAGGAGGQAPGGLGSPGGNTIFGEYSSSTGQRRESGYVDIMTSSIYAVPGHHGFKGQMGVGKNNLPTGSVWNVISLKYEGQGYSTFTTSTGYIGTIEPISFFVWYGGSGNYSHAIAGGSGGGAYAAYGGDSQGADWSDNNGKGFLDGGDGGDGANGHGGYNATVYGGGGGGGHGGGGGGGGGAAKNWWATPPGGGYYYSTGRGGQGGLGGQGGKGNNGCIIIYY